MIAPIRLAVFACFGAAALVFLFSNREPLSPIVFGQALPALPVGIWLLGFGTIGATIGICLQVLPRLAGVRAPARQRPSDRRTQPEINRDRGDWEPAGATDWDVPRPPSRASDPTAPVADGDDWNIEEPPPIETAVDPDQLQRPRPERAKTRPATRPPEYEEDDAFDFGDEPAEAPTASTEDVVDAPYRLIDPPLWTDDPDDVPNDKNRS